jgi:excisionase family DNA binding protein
MPVDRILTIDEVSKMLRVSTRDVEKIIREGKLKGKRTMEGWKINERDLVAYQKTTRR